MGLIILINSDTSLLGTIQQAYREHGQRLGYTIQMVSSEERIQESLNYDLPELVLVNCNDPKMNLADITAQMRADSWLHSFGVIGLYDSTTQDEASLSKQIEDMNLLVLLDIKRIRTHLIKCMNIILENWQLIFQREVTNHFIENNSGSFTIENDPLSVPIYAGIPVTNLAHMGLIENEERMQLQIALSELIINAIEHGNCKINYEEKNKALMEGKSIVELIAERCLDPEVAKTKVLFSWETSASHTTFTILDEGDGFDVAAMRKKTSEQDVMEFHGRGISMAESFVGELSYNEKGNQVSLTIAHHDAHTRETPQGFSHEEIILPKKGDIIFQEGERGDFLYYISNGRFSVHHNGKKVGSLSPADIFMGEMSFLLNNKRSARVTADTDGKLIKISRKSFVEVTRQFPHYGIFLSKLLARKLVRSNQERSS
jgi:CRP-like cAMP-binding protein/CheY-like chemotaxis protein